MNTKDPLNEHAIILLDDVGEYPLMDTRQIHKRHFSNRTLRRAQQKVRELESAGYLKGHRVATNWLPNKKDEGRVIMRRCPTMYGLTEKGRDAVEEWTSERPRRCGPRDVAAMTLRHRHGVASIRLTFDASCERGGIPRPQWWLESDVDPDAGKKLPPNQRSVLYHRFQDGKRTVACRPDAACRVLLPRISNSNSGDGEAVPVAFAWEVDLSTEGLRQLSRTKPRAYELWLERKAFQRYWNDPVSNGFILWVVKTRARMETITKAFARSAALGRCRFLIDPAEDANLLTESVWLTANGEERPIYNCKKQAEGTSS